MLYLTSDKGIQVIFEFNGDPNRVYQSLSDEYTANKSFQHSLLPEGTGGLLTISYVPQNKDLDGVNIDPKPQSAHFK